MCKSSLRVIIARFLSYIWIRLEVLSKVLVSLVFQHGGVRFDLVSTERTMTPDLLFNTHIYTYLG